MSSRPSSRASNPAILRQKSLPGLNKQVCTSNSPLPSPSSSRSTPSPDLTNRNKCLACLQRRPHTHHQYHNDGRTSPSGAAVASSAFGGRVRPSVRRLFDEPPSSPTSPSTHNNNNRSNGSSPRKEGSRSPSIARSVSSLSTNGGDSPKSSTDQRPRWVGAWSSTYTPPPSNSATRRQPLSVCNNYTSPASCDSANSGLDVPPLLLSMYSPTTSRQPPRRRETNDSIAKKNNARGRSPSTATVCLAARKGGVVLSKEYNNSPCYTGNQKSESSSGCASVCHPIGEDDAFGHEHDLESEGMESMHSRGEKDGYVTEPTSSHEGSPTVTATSCGEEGDSSLDDSLSPSHHFRPSSTTTTTPTSTLTDSRIWRFALVPAPPIETSPALIRKFLATGANTGPSSLSSSTTSSSPSVSGSPYSPLIVTAPAVAAVSQVQYLAKSRVVVTDATIANSTPGHPLSLSSALSPSSLAARSTATLSSTLASDEKESTPSLLAASLLSYETTTALLEQDGDDHSSLLTRWQQRSPSPLGQYSVLSADNDSYEEYDRSATPTPSGTAGSLRARPSIDSLSAIDRPGTPSSPAQELFSRIMDENNDHINSYSRRHSMGSLVDIVANKARMYLTPSNSRNSVDGSVAPVNYNSNNGRKTPSISSTLFISDPLAPLPPLPPTASPHKNTNRLLQHQKVVRVSSIESFPRHPSSSSSSNLRIQYLRDLFRSSSTSTTSSSATSVPASSNSNSLATTPSHSRTPTVETVFDSHHGTNNNSSSNTAGERGSRRNSLMDLLPSFTSSSSKLPSPPTAAATTHEDSRSTTSTSSSSSSSTITRHRSETNGSACSTSTTSSSPCTSPVLRKLGSRSSLSAIAPPMVLPQIKQSPKISHTTLLSLTTADTHDSSTSSSSEASPLPFAQRTNNGNNGTLRRPTFQVLAANTVGGNNNKPSPLPSFTVVNEIWMDPTTNTLHQLPGVLLTPSLPFPLTLPPSTPNTPITSTTTAPTTSQPSNVIAISTNGPAVEQQGQPASVEWPWTHMNPTDRDKWPTAFHISAQHGGILALPPTYSPGSELDEASALSLSRTHSNMGVIDYGSSVMEARRYFGNGVESVPSSLAGSRVSAGAGSLYYDETLGQTPYGNGFLHGPLGQYGQQGQFVPTQTYYPTGY